MTTLLLIDGSNYLFRAFHGMPDLRTSRDEPTGAMRGFLGMLGKVMSQIKPDFGAIIFDAPGPTFRHEKYPEYKANRPPMDDDLRVQIEPLLGILPQLGWPLLQVPYYEADDVMGTLARCGAQDDWKVVLATADKDMAQLVTDRITILNTLNNKHYDREGVKEKYGVWPEQMIDYLALVGDKVDNVPGINKCGPVTAAKWLDAYHNLDGIRAQAPTMKNKIGEYLREGLPFLDEAVDLVTIRTDCPLPAPYQKATDCVFQSAKSDALEAFAQRWEMSMTTIMRAAPIGTDATTGLWQTAPQVTSNKTAQTPLSLPPEQGSLFGSMESTTHVASPQEDALKTAISTGQLPPQPLVDMESVTFETVSTPMELEMMVSSILEAQTTSTRPLGLSVAWTGSDLHPTVSGVALASGSQRVYALDMDVLDKGSVSDALTRILEAVPLVALCQGNFTRHVLGQLTSAWSKDYVDLGLVDYVLAAHEKHTLSEMAARYLGFKLDTREWGIGEASKKTAQVTPELAREILAMEAWLGRVLHGVMMPILDMNPVLSTLYRDIEEPVMHVLFGMEQNGVLIDDFQLGQAADEMRVRLRDLEKAIYDIAGHEFNIASPKQLSHVLFEELGYKKPKKTASGTYSTNEEVLSQLALDYPMATHLLAWRQFSKLQSTYLEKLPQLMDRHGRIHTSYSQTSAVTGRLSSLSPNLQNIPVRTEEGRWVRRAFVAPEGCVLMSADYSQVELRLMAHFSQDEAFLKAFRHDEDIHKATAADVFNVSMDTVTDDLRRQAKTINFGLIYGMGPHGLAKNLGVTLEKAKAFITHYFQQYPGVKRYMESTREEVQAHGKVETLWGRRLWMPHIHSGQPMVRAAAERAAINAPLQGTAADIIKKAMVEVDRRLKAQALKARLLMQVHDELVLEVPVDEVEQVKTLVRDAMENAATLSVPLKVDIGVGPSWSDAH